MDLCKRRHSKVSIFLLSTIDNFPSCSAEGKFLSYFVIFVQKPTAQLAAEITRMASLITLMLEPLHASTLLFCHAGPPLFFYPYPKYQNIYMYMVYKLLINLFLSGQIQGFCSLGFFLFFKVSIFFCYFSPVFSLSNYFPGFPTKITVMDQ